MKKKILLVMMMSVFTLQMTACGKEAAPAETEPAETTEAVETTENTENTENTEIANPWKEITEDEAAALVPNSFSAPEGATNVVWRAMGDMDPSSFEVPGPVIELDFDLNDMSFTAREQITGDDNQDISGMFYDWTVKNDITLAIYDAEEGELLSKTALKLGKTAKVHIKVDSGMSRIGFQCTESDVEEAMKLLSMDGLDVEGIFTHYAKADYENKSDAMTQYEKFSWFVKTMEGRGADFKIRHIDNSAGAMEIHSEGFDMMRLGIVIYGLYPSEEIDKSVVLKPAMTLKSRVVHIKTLEAGRGIGYGWTYVTDKPTKVATVSVGYADGYPRALSNNGRVLIHGQYAPILGRVCMDQIMIDVTDIDDVKIRDEVVLFGKQGDNSISIEEVAEPANSFNYEMACHVSRRVPRVYFKDGKEIGEINYLV